MATPFHAQIDYAAFALWLGERDAITAPMEGVRALLEGLGAFTREDALTGGPPAPSQRRRSRWHFPVPGSTAAKPLEGRLAAMHHAYRAALWGLAGNELIANLTLRSALRVR